MRNAGTAPAEAAVTGGDMRPEVNDAAASAALTLINAYVSGVGQSGEARAAVAAIVAEVAPDELADALARFAAEFVRALAPYAPENPTPERFMQRLMVLRRAETGGGN